MPTKRLPKLQLKPRVLQPLGFITSVVDAFAEASGTKDREEVRQLIGSLRSGAFGASVKLADSITKQSYGDVSEHFAMNQLAALVRKVPIGDPTLDPEKEAWKKFLASEHLCRRTNAKLRAERVVCRQKYSVIRDISRSWIRRVIGDKPNLRRIYEDCGFGPGASVGVHGQATHVAAKLHAKFWSGTPTALQYAEHAMMGEPLMWEMLQNRSIFCVDRELFGSLFAARVKLCTANQITMVPKTAKVHRTIAIEPLLNGYIQKGIDVYLRKRLKRHGLDLGDQESNSALAKLGSLGGRDPYCTIDLSSASDSISIELVRDMLPWDWFDLLNRTRSPSYESIWGNGHYEKFVSMGNGFCFPLETLIFASLAYAVNKVSRGNDPLDQGFRVYGDDIVVHQHAALLLLEVLKYLGFKHNEDKTFLFGPFRESCGADYFEGANVRPYELDFVPITDRDLIKIANGLRAIGFVFYPDVWNTVHRRIDPKNKFMRPSDGPTDTALTVPLKIYLSSEWKRWDKWTQNWSWLEMRDTPVLDVRRVSPAVAMYGALYGLSSERRTGHPGYALRRRTRTRVVLSTNHTVVR